MLCKQVHFIGDTLGRQAELHTLRPQQGAEVDFCLSLDGELTTLVECKLGDVSPHRDSRQVEVRGGITITPASEWLAQLAA